MACLNTAGTENFPPVFILKSKIPKCFNASAGNEVSFECYFNSKSWMNPGIFIEQLKACDLYVGVTRNREALLLI